MATVKLFILVAVTGMMVSANKHKQLPHMCQADGESSEECHEKEWRRTNPPIIYHVDVARLTVNFYLHKNTSNPDDYIQLFPDDTEGIREAVYPSPAKWKILIPGFPSNGKSPFPNNVRDAYLQRMINFPNERYNIIVVDWQRDSMCKMDTLVKNTDSTYTEVVGKRVAEMLIFLHKQGLLTLSQDVHIIGFSMGAHVAGEAARFVFRQFFKKNLIYRISALDPAGDIIWRSGTRGVSSELSPRPMNRVPRIRRSFAGFLDAYHTSRYGIPKKIGDIDFFVNDESGQPGCELSTKDSYYQALIQIPSFKSIYLFSIFKVVCSHVYATELFAKSINDKSTKGCTGCDYIDLWKAKNCKCEDEPVLGEFVDEEKIDGYPAAVGKAFVKTEGVSEFKKRFQQVLIDAGVPNRNLTQWSLLC